MVSFEFTSTLTDFGYKEFMLADLLRQDPLFLRDGRLLVDVRGALGCCVNAWGWWISIGGARPCPCQAWPWPVGVLTHAPTRTTHNR